MTRPGISFEERWNNNNAAAARALGGADATIEALDNAAQAQSQLCVDLDAEISRLSALQAKAISDMEAAQETADELRKLFAPDH